MALAYLMSKAAYLSWLIIYLSYLFQLHYSVYQTKCKSCKYLKVMSAMPVHKVQTTYQNALS